MFNKVRIPDGKTEVVMVQRECQCDLEIGDKGYIDGYVTAADSRPYAIFIAVSGARIGEVNMVSLYCIKLIY